MALTVHGVKKLTKAGRYPDGGNLYLQVTPSGGRSWIFRYSVRGRERDMGLGPLRDFTLDQARQRALKARQQLRDGIDPIDAQQAERNIRMLEAAKRLTFQQAAEQYFNSHERKWSNAEHRRQFLSSLQDYAYPVIGKVPVAMIDTTLVLKVLQPIWQDKHVTATRVRSRIEAVLGWATVSGYRSGDNPARWQNHLMEVLPAKGEIAKVEHHKAMSYAAIPGFMATLRERQSINAKALQFLVLTAARTSEVRQATWSEIDLAAQLWTVPPDRMKGRKEHRVPLSDQAAAILRALPVEGAYVFPGTRKGKPIGRTAMASVLEAMQIDATVHGFRSAFRDWAGETTAFASDICEAALAHAVGDKTRVAYQRGDLLEKRRKLMRAWASYCNTPLRTGSVTPIRAA